MDFSQLAEDAVMERSNARLFRLHGYTDYIHNARIILALYIYIYGERGRACFLNHSRTREIQT